MTTCTNCGRRLTNPIAWAGGMYGRVCAATKGYEKPRKDGKPKREKRAPLFSRQRRVVVEEKQMDFWRDKV